MTSNPEICESHILAPSSHAAKIWDLWILACHTRAESGILHCISIFCAIAVWENMDKNIEISFVICDSTKYRITGSSLLCAYTCTCTQCLHTHARTHIHTHHLWSSHLLWCLYTVCLHGNQTLAMCQTGLIDAGFRACICVCVCFAWAGWKRISRYSLLSFYVASEHHNRTAYSGSGI